MVINFSFNDSTASCIYTPCWWNHPCSKYCMMLTHKVSSTEECVHMWPGLQKSTIWAQDITNFRLCSIITYELLVCTNKTKSLIITAEFNGLSSEIYGNRIATTFRAKDNCKNITKCAHMVRWFSHALSHMWLQVVLL